MRWLYQPDNIGSPPALYQVMGHGSQDRTFFLTAGNRFPWMDENDPGKKEGVMRRRARKVRLFSLVLLILLSCLFLESASPPESSARILKTSVPICEMREEWTGKWLIVGQETVPQE